MSADGGTGGRKSWRRAFGWGVLSIGDATADVVAVDPDVPFTWGTVDEAFCVVVRHGQDVDDDALEGLAPDDEVPWAEVSLEVRLDEAAPEDVDGDGVVAVPTGVLTIGDADEEERFDIEPGLWRSRSRSRPCRTPRSSRSGSAARVDDAAAAEQGGRHVVRPLWTPSSYR